MRSLSRYRIAALAACTLLALTGCAELEALLGPDTQVREPDVVYDPTPPEVVAAMLEMAQLKAGDVLYDLGSGDGRIAIEAARRAGVRAVGIDIDPELVQRARERALSEGLAGRVQFRQEDLFQADFGAATVVTLFLGPELNLRLRPRLLAELAPGTRVISHQYDMGQWAPARERRVGNRVIYLWIVPER